MGVEVTVCELKDHLDEYLRRVRDGEAIIVTEDGRAIARVSPEHGPAEDVPDGPENPEDTALWELVKQGKVSWNGKRHPATMPTVKVRDGFAVSDLLIQERQAAEDQLMENIFGERVNGRERGRQALPD